MRWSDAFATGIDRIDNQHRMLFKMTSDYRAALDEGGGDRVYETLLDSLAGYARLHFRFEEGCMDRCRCPAAESNRTAHERFVATLDEFRQRFAARGFDSVDARRLVDTLDHWLATHIARLDIQLREWTTHS